MLAAVERDRDRLDSFLLTDAEFTVIICEFPCLPPLLSLSAVWRKDGTVRPLGTGFDMATSHKFDIILLWLNAQEKFRGSWNFYEISTKQIDCCNFGKLT